MRDAIPACRCARHLCARRAAMQGRWRLATAKSGGSKVVYLRCCCPRSSAALFAVSRRAYAQDVYAMMLFDIDITTIVRQRPTDMMFHDTRSVAVCRQQEERVLVMLQQAAGGRVMTGRRAIVVTNTVIL